MADQSAIVPLGVNYPMNGAATSDSSGGPSEASRPRRPAEPARCESHEARASSPSDPRGRRRSPPRPPGRKHAVEGRRRAARVERGPAPWPGSRTRCAARSRMESLADAAQANMAGLGPCPAPPPPIVPACGRAPSATTTMEKARPRVWRRRTRLADLVDVEGSLRDQDDVRRPGQAGVQGDPAGVAPITSTTITRWWRLGGGVSRSIASVATWSAVSKPNVISVAARSLSIVFGTPRTARSRSVKAGRGAQGVLPPIAIGRRGGAAASSPRPGGAVVPLERVRPEVPEDGPPAGQDARVDSIVRSSYSLSGGPSSRRETRGCTCP